MKRLRSEIRVYGLLWLLLSIVIGTFVLWPGIKSAMSPPAWNNPKRRPTYVSTIPAFYDSGKVIGRLDTSKENCKFVRTGEREAEKFNDRYGFGVLGFGGFEATAEFLPDASGVVKPIPEGTIVDVKSVGILWHKSDPLYAFGTGPDNRFLRLPINTIRAVWSPSGLAKSISASGAIALGVTLVVMAVVKIVVRRRSKNVAERLARNICPKCQHPLPMRVDYRKGVFCSECGRQTRNAWPPLEPEKRKNPPEYPGDWRG